jgi:IclR family transcriptional regulator, acetate operon repressor
MSNTGTQAIDRAVQLLTRVVEAAEPLTFTELSADPGLPRSTTSRLLAALEAGRLVEREENGAYTAGPLFAVYAASHDQWSQLASLAEPVLREVVDAIGETVNLAVPRGGTVVHLAQVDSTYVLGVRDWRRVTVPPHTSALGKILFAHGALALPEGPLEKRTRRSLATPAALRRDLETVRRRGFATTREELEVGLDAAAVPIIGASGDVIAALGVSGPSARMRGSLDAIGRQLISYGTELSQLLRSRTRAKGVA